MIMEAIRVEHLTKRFDSFTAVDDLTFSVRTGELFGLLGPNGAGKTTTINMLATLLTPTSGSAQVAGHDVARSKDSVRRAIGLVFQETALDTKLTGKENLTFHAMMYGMGREEREQRISEVMRLVELQDRAHVLVENYSGGMKRRLEIARGLIHRPRVLFLDEPTLGLDAQTRRHIWEYIGRLNAEHEVTIILTTHYMEEADFLCQKIAIMDRGRFVALDTPEKLKDLLGGDVVSLEIQEDFSAFAEELKSLDWVKSLKHHESLLTLTMEKGERRIPEIIQRAQKSGLSVTCVNLRKPSLENVFLHFTGKTMRDREASQAERNRSMMRGHFRRRR
jgi:ABC-2 type transport system ATP-binding protein